LLFIILTRYWQSAAWAGERRRCGDGAADSGVGTGTILFQPLPSTVLKNKVKKENYINLVNNGYWKDE
jgi:hypothetical protein